MPSSLLVQSHSHRLRPGPIWRSDLETNKMRSEWAFVRAAPFTSALKVLIFQPKTWLSRSRSRSALPPFSAARHSLLLFSLLRFPAYFPRRRELRLTHHLLMGSTSESGPLEVLAPLELLDEGLRALFRPRVFRFRELRFASLPSRSEQPPPLEMLVERLRALPRLRVSLLRSRRSFRMLRLLLGLPWRS